MLPLKFKKNPTFDIKKDLAQILDKADIDFSSASESKIKSIKNNVSPLPYLRAYIQDKETSEPVAIFDALEYDDFGAIIKLSLAHLPKNLDNPLGFANIEVMNILREVILGSDRFYRLTLFQADKICFHFSISADLVIFLCDRLRDKDIIDRAFWTCLADHPDWDDSLTDSHTEGVTD